LVFAIQVFNMTEITVFSPDVSELGEGPTFDVTSQTLFWFDILGKRLLEQRTGDGRFTAHQLPFMASALASIDGDRQLVVAEDGLYVRDRVTGRLIRRVAVEAENKLTRSNDSRTHPSGALWFSTMGKNAEHEAGAIYWYREGEVKKLYPNITIPNGICFSPDGRTAYFTDTSVNIMMRVDCNPITGLPIGEPSVFFDNSKGQGGLDGSVCDGDGQVWNARWGGSTLDCYNPEGMRIKSIALPVKQPTCPAFCGTGLGDLAVTSAWQHMDEAARKADPEAGKTFIVELGLRGRAEPSVAL
jgi:sugar lactone lactonase